MIRTDPTALRGSKIFSVESGQPQRTSFFAQFFSIFTFVHPDAWDTVIASFNITAGSIVAFKNWTGRRHIW